ncbi:MAG: hypothetical protein KDK30_03920 [Leptospiraceae bacterium]|nr:hypothetical protein [Leptospiraceae bacterium]MCB1317401.1 hypothetical protein [Leptospiraceae bacterium]MCB1318940.1 hypothetical protein [Leptospiraceae bacterium]
MISRFFRISASLLVLPGTNSACIIRTYEQKDLAPDSKVHVIADGRVFIESIGDHQLSVEDHDRVTHYYLRPGYIKLTVSYFDPEYDVWTSSSHDLPVEFDGLPGETYYLCPRVFPIQLEGDKQITGWEPLIGHQSPPRECGPLEAHRKFCILDGL